MAYLKIIGYIAFATVIIASFYMSIKYGNNKEVDFEQPSIKSNEN